MNYIFYQTKTNFNNEGDVLINKALIENLRKYGKITCYCGKKDIPSSFIEKLNIREEEKLNCESELVFSLKILLSKIKSNKKDNFYIVSGLGQQGSKSIKKMIKNVICGLFIFPIYRIFKVQIIRIGASIDPMSKIFGVSEKIKSLCISSYYVRDTKSLEFLHNAGIKKAKLCPDLSWLYLKDRKKVQNNDTNYITVNMTARRRGEVFEEDITKQLQWLLHEISNKNEKKIKILFVYQVKEDYELCNKLYMKFKNDYECEFETRQLDLQEAEKYYGKSSLNISNRLHSLLLCYKYGSIPIALIDEKKQLKISQTFFDCNLDDLIIDIYGDSNNEKRCISNIDKVLNNKTEYLKKIYDIEEQKNKEIEETLNKCFGYIS